MTALTTAPGGYRATGAKGIDCGIRLSTAAVVLAVAGIAAYVSYWQRLCRRPGARRERAHRPAGTGHDRRPRVRLQHAHLVRGPAPGTGTSAGPLAARSGHRGHSDSEHGPGLVPRSGWSGGRGLAGGQPRRLLRTFWSGSSAPPKHPDASHQPSTAATIRRAALRSLPSQPAPPAAGSTATATAIRTLRACDRRVILPGSRPLSAGSMATGFSEPRPIIVQRWPRTGSVCKLAIRSLNASLPICSGAPPAAGHEPGLPNHGNNPDSSIAEGGRRRRIRPWPLQTESAEPAIPRHGRGGAARVGITTRCGKPTAPRSHTPVLTFGVANPARYPPLRCCSTGAAGLS